MCINFRKLSNIIEHYRTGWRIGEAVDLYYRAAWFESLHDTEYILIDNFHGFTQVSLKYYDNTMSSFEILGN
jgi:hypothetical protein